MDHVLQGNKIRRAAPFRVAPCHEWQFTLYIYGVWGVTRGARSPGDCASGLHSMQRRALRDLVIFVVDGKNRLAPQPYRTFRAVLGREPETIHFHVSVVDCG